MLETAMLKVFTTELLWEAINETFQIYGGSAYFNDLPLERMLRDARINQIGEGSNEVLTSFIALVGMRGPGMEFKEIYDTMLKPTREGGIGKAWSAGMNRLGATVRVPDIPVQSRRTAIACLAIGSRLIWRFNFAVNRSLIAYREPILDMQTRPGTNRLDGNGTFRIDLCAQPLGRRAPGGAAQWRHLAVRTKRRPIFSCANLSVGFAVIWMASITTTTRPCSQPRTRPWARSLRSLCRFFGASGICPKTGRKRHEKWFKTSRGSFRLRGSAFSHHSHPLSQRGAKCCIGRARACYRVSAGRDFSCR